MPALDPLSALLQDRKKKETEGKAHAEKSERTDKTLVDVESTLGNLPASKEIVGENADTAVQRIRRALAPSSNVDFPTITDICERVVEEPSEAKEAVQALLGGMGNQHAYRRRLKALTIMNELVYDEKAAVELRNTPGSRETLRELQCARDTGLGPDTDENMRMFATELERKCFSDEVETLSSQQRHRKRDQVVVFLNQVKEIVNNEDERKRDKVHQVTGLLSESLKSAIQKDGAQLSSPRDGVKKLNTGGYAQGQATGTNPQSSPGAAPAGSAPIAQPQVSAPQFAPLGHKIPISNASVSNATAEDPSRP